MSDKKEKKLGMFNIYSLGVGGAIGSGIFVMMGLGIGFTGHSIWLAVMVGCFYMLLAFMYQPIMSSMFVLPGGDYDMKVMLFGPLLTGVSGINTYVHGFALAMYGMSIVDYASMVFPAILPYKSFIAFLVLTLSFAATIRGSKFMANITSAMTVILLVAIALFIGFGLPKTQGAAAEGSPFFLNGGLGFLQAIAIMSFACQGTTMAPVSMMEVTKKPRRTIPVAIMWITLTVAIVYGLMGFVASHVLPIDEVAGQSLALVAQRIFPRWLYVVFVLGGAVFAIATSMVSSIAMLRYPCARVAEDGWMPAVFKKTTKSGYPYVIQGFFYLISVLPIVFGFSLDAIVSLIMVPWMLMNAYLNISLIRLVKKYPEQWKKSVFHMPKVLFTILCCAGSLCAILVAVNLFVGLSLSEKIVCAAILLSCVVIAAVRMKTGAVDKEALLAKQKAIAEQAIAATDAEG